MSYQEEIIASLTKPFRFLDVPYDVRCVVYILLFNQRPPVAKLLQGTARTSPVGIMALLTANKQVYAEMLPFLYTNFTLLVDTKFINFSRRGALGLCVPGISLQRIQALHRSLENLKIGVLNYCHVTNPATPRRDCLEFWRLGHFSNLKEVRFTIKIPRNINLQARPADFSEFGMLLLDPLACAEWLEMHWTDQESRCMGLRKRIKKVAVRPSKIFRSDTVMPEFLRLVWTHLAVASLLSLTRL